MNRKVKQIKSLNKVRTVDEIREHLHRSITALDPNIVLKEGEKEFNNSKGKQLVTTPKSNAFKVMTLFEFENGMLLTTVIPEQYKTFGIDLMRNIQKEYNCQTPSEKATAELVTSNYIRTLEIQRRINSYLDLGTITDTGVRFLAIMSQELDRANRHYLSSLEALKSMKQPQLGVNIRANTAVIGQNQVVQANNLPNDS